jgi:hypothetical protein
MGGGGEGRDVCTQIGVYFVEVCGASQYRDILP